MLHSSFLGVRLLHWLVAMMLFGAILLGFAQDQGWLKNKPFEPKRVDFDAQCDLRAGPCETVLDNGAKVSFGILPLDIPVAKTLDVAVRVSGLQVEKVMLDLNGINMKMPPNRVELKPGEAGRFNGQAGLMLCTRSAMEWEAVVELTTPQGIYHVPFRFITVSDGNYANLTG